MIWISFGSDTFTDTGFELQYLPYLHISGVDPPFVFINKESRVKISGDFNRNLTYGCVLFEDDTNDPILEIIAEYRNESTLVCDIVVTHHITLSLAVRRKEDNQTSNALKIIPTPHYVIHSVEPSIISETEAGAGGQLLSITLSREFTFNGNDQFHCRLIDEIGTTD